MQLLLACFTRLHSRHNIQELSRKDKSILCDTRSAFSANISSSVSTVLQLIQYIYRSSNNRRHGSRLIGYKVIAARLFRCNVGQRSPSAICSKILKPVRLISLAWMVKPMPLIGFKMTEPVARTLIRILGFMV